MAKSKIKRATETVKKVSSFSGETKELIDATRQALFDVQKLVEHVKTIVDETDFPELKDIHIPKMKLPESKKYRHDLVKYDPKDVNWTKLEAGLNKYKDIMYLLYEVDVSTDRSFQKMFNGFYRIRQKPAEFYKTLYSYLEAKKSTQVSFKSALTHLYDSQGKLESSFASKIAATINPNLPVWDSIVLKHLGLKTPGYNLSVEERKNRIVEMYNSLQKFYSDFLKHKLSNKMIGDFDEKFPNNNISAIKKIDLILWQTRN